MLSTVKLRAVSLQSYATKSNTTPSLVESNRVKIRQVFWLKIRRFRNLPGFPVVFLRALLYYSDRIAQDFHRLPYYPIASAPYF